MKIAVCLFGHIRTYRYCCEFFRKHLLSLYDCDVFMHTWSSIESTTVTWHNDKIKENISVLDKKQELIELYNLKSIFIETQDEKTEEYGYIHVSFSGFDEIKTQSIWAVRCLHHSIQKSFELMEKYAFENETKYDFVVFIRPDILLHKDFEISRFTYGLEKTDIDSSFFFSSLIQPHTRANDLSMAHANDLIFFATPSVMKNVMNNTSKFLNMFYDGLHIRNKALETYELEMIQGLGYKTWRIEFLMYIDFDILREKNIIEKNSTAGITVATKKMKVMQHWKILKQYTKETLRIPIEILKIMYFIFIKRGK